jgi:mercuric ion transport protein
MSESDKVNKQSGKGFLLAGILAALGASICCVGPLVLLALGVSGAWISSLTALEPYRPILIGLALLFLAFAFYRLYFASRNSTPGSSCANPHTLKRHRLAFWIVAVLVFSLIAVPWVAPLFY